MARRWGNESGQESGQAGDWREVLKELRELKDELRGVEKTCNDIRVMATEIGRDVKDLKDKYEGRKKEGDGGEERKSEPEEKREEVKGDSAGDEKEKWEKGKTRELRSRERSREREQKVRDERKRNVIIRGIKCITESERLKLREMLKEELNREVYMEEINDLLTNTGEIMVKVRLREEEDKKELLEKRREIGKKKKIFIGEDLTYNERRARWMMKEREGEERRRGKDTEITDGKIRIEKEWWEWDVWEGKWKEVDAEEIQRLERGRREREEKNRKIREEEERERWECQEELRRRQQEKEVKEKRKREMAGRLEELEAEKERIRRELGEEEGE